MKPDNLRIAVEGAARAVEADGCRLIHTILIRGTEGVAAAVGLYRAAQLDPLEAERTA